MTKIRRDILFLRKYRQLRHMITADGLLVEIEHVLDNPKLYSCEDVQKAFDIKYPY